MESPSNINIWSVSLANESGPCPEQKECKLGTLQFVVCQINELQADLSKLQSQQVSLQLEHKELKKKQRRSERYYTNKQTKDSGSQSTSVHDDDVDMVGDVSLQGELTPDDRSEEGWFKMKLHLHV